MTEQDHAFTLEKHNSSPLVIDSPHSGRTYPEDFQHKCKLLDMAAAEDRYVDHLLENTKDYGASLLCAQFPRTYIDPNRPLDDIDTDMLSAPWPEIINPSPKTKLGIGLIRSKLHKGQELYDRKLTVREVQNRIEHYYTPYHRTLRNLLEEKHQKHSCYWHIDMHSMPAQSSPYNFIIGDRDGTTCDPAFRKIVKDTLESFGYSVTVNTPYKGVEIVRRYGQPEKNKHSLQLEINKALYLDANTQEKSPGFKALKIDIEQFTKTVAEWGKFQL